MNIYKKYCRICEAVTQHFENKNTKNIECKECYKVHTIQAQHNYEEDAKYNLEEKNET